MRRSRKVRAKEEADGGHERWVVSYADFITLLFAFFTTMYALSSVNEAKYKVMSKSIGKAFNRPGIGMAGSLGRGDTGGDIGGIKGLFARSFNRDYRVIEEHLVVLERGDRLSVNAERRGVVISLSERVVFSPGKAEILDDAGPVIDRIASVLKKMPNLIRIEGHTDNLPINTREFPSNWELSVVRAVNILRYMVDKDGLEPGRVSATGYGEFRPVSSNNTVEGRARNRRVDIVVLSSVGGINEPM